MKKKNSIRARLTVYGLQEMDTRQLNFFRKWIMAIATEMKTAKPKDYSKIFRATLFK